MFVLDSRLAHDTVEVLQMPLSTVLLAKDANYPWCILVPRRQGIKEIYQLSSDDRIQLLEESCQLSQVMERLFQPIKLNVAALGNMVPQLHLHHIARFETDPAWPGPVWGVVEAKTYDDNTLQQRVEQLRQGME